MQSIVLFGTKPSQRPLQAQAQQECQQQGIVVDRLCCVQGELPVAERAQRYRQLASEAFLLAEITRDCVLRASYLSLASGWHALALEIEHSNGLADRHGAKELNDQQRPDANRKRRMGRRVRATRAQNAAT
jgi:hypothetical protein